MDKIFIKNSFHDFDAFLESTKWDMEFEQLRSGRFHAEMISYIDTDIQVGKVRYNVTLLQKGSSPDGYSFAIHHPKSAPFKWRFLDFPSNSIIVFPENRDHQGISQENHHPFIITIHEDFLLTTAEEIGLSNIEKFVIRGEVHLCDPIAIQHIQTYLGSLLSAMEFAPAGSATDLVTYEIKWKIARMILLALSSSKVLKSQKRQLHHRKKKFDRIMEYVDANLFKKISVPEICREVGINERTLRNIFYEQVSLSPNRFIKCHRLNNVHRALKRLNSTQVTISDIMNKNGFWHMGQFALDYRKLFGERPSETLMDI